MAQQIKCWTSVRAWMCLSRSHIEHLDPSEPTVRWEREIAQKAPISPASHRQWGTRGDRLKQGAKVGPTLGMFSYSYACTMTHLHPKSYTETYAITYMYILYTYTRRLHFFKGTNGQTWSTFIHLTDQARISSTACLLLGILNSH